MAAIILLAVRPRRIPPWLWPVAGALLMIAFGYEPALSAAIAVLRQWNILLFIAGLMCVAGAAEESGAFEFLTQRILVSARGSRRRLFVYLFIAGAVLTIVLSNDATAIVLTPIIYRAVADRGGDPMPFLFGSIFVADTASFGTPFSNPANVLILPHARFLPYLWHMGPPELAAIGINLGLFLFFFRRELRGRYEPSAEVAPRPSALRTLAVFGGIGLAYVGALAASLPLGPIALIGGLAALATARVRLPVAARHIGWQTFALLAGLFALLDAVSRAGFTAWALRGLDDAMRYGAATVTVVSASAAALFSNVLNNLPVAVVSSGLVERTASPHLAYPLIAGVDLGPNLMTTGSLATILWLSILAQHGVRISLRRYMRLGAIVVPATLGVTLAWLIVNP